MCHVKHFTSKTQKIGEKGEDLAVMFLVKRGFRVIERNFTTRYGEIDVIARKSGILHFIEVKTLRFTGNPAQNVTRTKLRRMIKTIAEYFAEKRVSRGTRWQIDVILVVLREGSQPTKIEFLTNVHF
jgi:putative endonuclease